jgi:hypothetical protein
MWHMVMVYVGFVCGVLSALVSFNLILRADYEGLGLCVLGAAPEEVAGGINIAGYLCMEVHNLNDHGTLDMAQGNRKDKGRDMLQAVNESFVKELFQSLGLSCQMHKQDKEIA